MLRKYLEKAVTHGNKSPFYASSPNLLRRVSEKKGMVRKQEGTAGFLTN